MNKKEVKTAVAPSKKSVPRAKKVKDIQPLAPMFVEAERMFEKFAAIAQETSQRAFENFLRRGGGFGREFDDWFRAESEILRPVSLELTEENGSLLVDAAVPGFKPEEIEINVKDNLLTISGESESHKDETIENVFHSDFSSDRFFRQMMLPRVIDADKVTARLTDGILHIKLPKVPEPKPIAIAAG